MVKGLSYVIKRVNTAIQCYCSNYNMHDFPSVLKILKQTYSICLSQGIEIRAYLPADSAAWQMFWNKGDTLILYTDGVTEAMDHENLSLRVNRGHLSPFSRHFFTNMGADSLFPPGQTEGVVEPL
jgi:hypothetical protein